MDDMIQAGMDVVRLNFSHGSPQEHMRRAENVRNRARAHGHQVGVFADLQGPKIRIERFKDGKISLEKDDRFILDAGMDPMEGTSERVGLTFRELPNDVHRGDTLLLDDGRLVLWVDEVVDAEIRCRVVVGGELTMSMLEVQYDPHTREHQAPLQMKANNGIFIIDDMGRQRVSPQEVFNRWIVPLEEKKDYLSLGSGRHFSVPFNVVLVFSTNMRPHDLADEAFLRRIGYKIGFPYLTDDQYSAIWQQQCADRGIPFDREVLDYAIQSLHRSKSVPLLPCHPRDLLGLCIDKAVYSDQPRQVTKPILDWAWENYFARTDGDDLGLTDIGETR